MKNFNFRVILMSVLFVLIFITGCSKNDASKNLKTFAVDGIWDIPPVFHGNPYSPGGVGVAEEYIYGKLAMFMPLTNSFENYLAESVIFDEDKLTVKLKDGIYWYDGIPLTSKDVYARFVLNGAISGMNFIWDYIDSIETPDDKTVVFNYNDEDSIILNIYILVTLINTPYHIYEKWMEPAEVVLKLRRENKENTPEFKEKFEELRESLLSYKPDLPMGYGPFEIEKVTSSNMLLKKVDKYPGIENIDIDEILIHRSPSGEVSTPMLKNGEFDIKNAALSRDVTESILSDNPTIDLTVCAELIELVLALNNREYPFSDFRFRQALAYIIDRDYVRELAFYYFTTVEYMAGILPSIQKNWIDVQDLNPYKVNHKKAEDLLIDMGMTKAKNGFWHDKDGKKLSFTITCKKTWFDTIIAAEEIARQLTNFGIETNMNVYENSIAAQFVNSGRYDMSIEAAFISKFHPYSGYQGMYAKDTWGDFAVGFDPQIKGSDGKEINITELTDELGKTYDSDKQKEIIQELAWATNQYLPVIELVERNSMLFINDGKRVTGWPDEEELINGLTAEKVLYPIKWMLDGKIKGVQPE